VRASRAQKPTHARRTLRGTGASAERGSKASDNFLTGLPLARNPNSHSFNSSSSRGSRNFNFAITLQESQLQIPDVIGRIALRRGTENLFEFPTKMSFGCELQLGGSRFARITLGDKLLSQSALEVPQPIAGCALHILLENALQVALGYSA